MVVVVPNEQKVSPNFFLMVYLLYLFTNTKISFSCSSDHNKR